MLSAGMSKTESESGDGLLLLESEGFAMLVELLSEQAGCACLATTAWAEAGCCCPEEFGAAPAFGYLLVLLCY